MPEKKDSPLKKMLIAIPAIAAILWFLFLRTPGSFAASLPVIGNIMIVAIGFGAVIMIHEFGHFIVAKVSGIKVEAFSIGFPPTLLGIQKMEDCIRLRLLPKFFPKNTGNDNDDGIIFTIPGKHRPSPTEYRISLIPFGGFVKMLGQEDAGLAEQSDDPRSYANKPVSIRMAVVLAGVVFNAISAVLIFMIVFLIGVDLMPAVVGKVRPNSPAAIAGIREKDRIVELNGETFVDFMSLSMSTLLSDDADPLKLKIERPDGTIKDVTVIPEKPAGSRSLLPGKDTGILQSESLTIFDGLGPEYTEKTGLMSRDTAVAVNGIQLEDAWHLNKIVDNALTPSCTLTVERTNQVTNEVSRVTAEMPLEVSSYNDNFKTGYDLAHIHSIIPRLKITYVKELRKTQTFSEALSSFWKYRILKQTQEIEEREGLESGDIILQVGSISDPTFKDLKDETYKYAEQSMPMKVLRDGRAVELTVTPKIVRKPTKDDPKGKVKIGIVTVFDMDNPVVADTIDIKNGPSALEIPKGATITAMDGEKVSSFYDVINIIKKNKGERMSIDFVTADGKNAGGTGVAIHAAHDYITVKTSFADMVPFDYHKEIFKASNAGEAITMGLKQTKMFIVNSYLTLKGLISRNVESAAVSGPVGIVTISYKIAATQSMTYFAYFMGLISSCLAFMNLLPIPVVDGGVIVLLIVEKIKGSPISQKVQEIISYAGLAFIITLFVWLTKNDIMNLIR